MRKSHRTASVVRSNGPANNLRVSEHTLEAWAQICLNSAGNVKLNNSLDRSKRERITWIERHLTHIRLLPRATSPVLGCVAWQNRIGFSRTHHTGARAQERVQSTIEGPRPSGGRSTCRNVRRTDRINAQSTSQHLVCRGPG